MSVSKSDAQTKRLDAKYAARLFNNVVSRSGGSELLCAPAAGCHTDNDTCLRGAGTSFSARGGAQLDPSLWVHCRQPCSSSFARVQDGNSFGNVRSSRVHARGSPVLCVTGGMGRGGGRAGGDDLIWWN